MPHCNGFGVCFLHSTSSKCWALHPHMLFQKASSTGRNHLPQATQNLQPLPFRAVSKYGIIILIRRCVRNRICAAVVWFPALPGMAAWKNWVKTVGGGAVVMETASLAASFQYFLPSDDFLPIFPLCHLGSPLPWSNYLWCLKLGFGSELSWMKHGKQEERATSPGGQACGLRNYWHPGLTSEAES